MIFKGKVNGYTFNGNAGYCRSVSFYRKTNTRYVGIYILSQLRGIYYFHILIYLGVGSSSGFADSGASWGIFLAVVLMLEDVDGGRSMSML